MIPETISEVELARDDSTEFRSVRMALKADGTLVITGHDIGPAVAVAWGDCDYEFGIRIARSDAPAMLFALALKCYAGDTNAVERTSNLAQKAGIDPGFWSWT